MKAFSLNLEVSPPSENILEYFIVLNSLINFSFLTALTGYTNVSSLAQILPLLRMARSFSSTRKSGSSNTVKAAALLVCLVNQQINTAH